MHCSKEFRAANYNETMISGTFGAVKRSSPIIEMTKDGFAFLVMGFRGEKAAKFKEDYIAEFNRKEEELRSMYLPAEIDLDDSYQRDMLALRLLSRVDQSERRAKQLEAQVQVAQLQITEVKAEVEVVSTQLAIAAPKAEVHDRIVKTKKLMLARDVAALLSVMEKDVFAAMSQAGWTHKVKRDGSWHAYAAARKSGYVQYKFGHTPTGVPTETVCITGRGLTRLATMMGSKVSQLDLLSSIGHLHQ
ncbi:phage regulatory protein/antirepressor Ant [Aureimonas glaciei]|uniref:Antirepressor protein C-terminal domain-containing protein n=1 Tax=Aureimonas glaciei TaxID=1776957 RepID=A0A916YAU1_9HYPH|nr:phage regulatory protein/antirepressor Ant [Aureimonas glaciei]GGD38282.1 hypothetical protein GCM10011335_46270 [Aureimonas glaciei]